MKIIRSLDDPLLPLAGTAVALGMFDGVHAGHRAVLSAAVEGGGERGLTPSVFTFALSDPPRVKKGAKKLASQHLMEEVLADLGMEYAVSPDFSEIRHMTARQFVEDFLIGKLGAGLVSCGYNFTFGKDKSGNAEILAELCAELGIDCVVVPEVELEQAPVSSTRIRQYIAAGKIPEANQLLGRMFTIDFQVVQGNRIGRTLGSPTINQPFPAGFAIPRFGVYATVATVDDKYYSGVTNVGIKPTVGSDVPLAETYIQGFSGDLYGREIRVAFLEFIRPEKKFSSLDELRSNILRDADTAAAIYENFINNTGAAGIEEKE